MEPLATSFYEVHFKIQVNLNIFVLTALYASPILTFRKFLWEGLYDLANSINLPWIIIGDFEKFLTLAKILEADQLIGGK